MAMGEYWHVMLPDLPALIEAQIGRNVEEEELALDFVYEVFGGKWQFYMPLIHELISVELRKAAAPREILFTSDVGIVECANSYLVSCQAYYVPIGYCTKGAFEKVTLAGFPPISDETINALATVELDKIRATQAVDGEKQGDNVVVEEGDVVWCSLEPRIDGQLWEAGALKRHRAILAKGAISSDLYEAIEGKSVGNHKIQFTLTESFGPLAGKVVEADLTIHGILTRTLPEWSDELAKKLGAPSYDAVVSAQRDGWRRRKENERADQVATAAVVSLMQQMTFDPVPTEWVKMKATERYDSLLKRAGSTEKLLTVTNAKDENQLMLRLYDSARGEVWSVITLLTYGAYAGIARKDDEVIGNLASYFQRVVDHLVHNDIDIVPTSTT